MLVHIGEHFFLVLSSGSIFIYGLYCADPFLYDRHGEHEGRVTSYMEGLAACGKKDWKDKRR